MELHPLCTLFPRMGGAEFDALRDDIAANGLMTPITTFQGQILDGGNRYRACLEAGIEPQFVEYDGNDPAHFVLSSNFFRRHLTPGQQATVVALAQDWTKAQQRGGDRKSDQAATLPLDSVASRQALSAASDRTQRDADKLARTSPELAKKVVDGELTLPQALKKIAPEPETPERPREIPVGDEMRLYDEGGTTGAFVAAVRAKDAIKTISKKDPNAMKCIESIQEALNRSRTIVKEWVESHATN